MGRYKAHALPRVPSASPKALEGNVQIGPFINLDPDWNQIFETDLCKFLKKLAGTTRLELATSAVTGQRSNQLNYVPSFFGKLQESGFICWADDIPKQLD